ncbi:MAG: hypothetical protein ACR2QO_24940 [Acidimicrobiales bacterium]
MVAVGVFHVGEDEAVVGDGLRAITEKMAWVLGRPACVVVMPPLIPSPPSTMR